MANINEILKKFISELERIYKEHHHNKEEAEKREEKIRIINEIIEILQEPTSNDAISFYNKLIDNHDSQYMQVIREYVSERRISAIIEIAKNIVTLSTTGLLEIDEMREEVKLQCVTFTTLATQLKRIKKDEDEDKKTPNVTIIKDTMDSILKIKGHFSHDGNQIKTIEDTLLLEKVLKETQLTEEEIICILSEIAKNNYRIYSQDKESQIEAADKSEHMEQQVQITEEPFETEQEIAYAELQIKAEISETLQNPLFTKKLIALLYPDWFQNNYVGNDYQELIEIVSDVIYNIVISKNVTVAEAIRAFSETEKKQKWDTILGKLSSEYITEEFALESAKSLIEAAQKFIEEHKTTLEGIPSERKESFSGVILESYCNDEERQKQYQTYKDSNMTDMAIKLSLLEIEFILQAIEVNDKEDETYFALCNRLDSVLNSIQLVISAPTDTDEYHNKRNIIFLAADGKEQSFFETDIENIDKQFYKHALSCIQNLQEPSRNIHRGAADRFPNLKKNNIYSILKNRSRIYYKLNGDDIIIIGFDIVDGNDEPTSTMDTRVSNNQAILTELLENLKKEDQREEILAASKIKLKEVTTALEESTSKK